VLLYRFQGIDHDPPFVLHVDARTLGEHLRAMGGLRELFPDESPDISALQLFLVRLMETVDIVLSGLDSSDADRRHLVPVASGVSSRTEPPVSSCSRAPARSVTEQDTTPRGAADGVRGSRASALRTARQGGLWPRGRTVRLRAQGSGHQPVPVGVD